MSVLLLSCIGGFVSAVSTSTGSLLAKFIHRFESLRKYHMSMDFALGVMLSAVAFSLVGPELLHGKDLRLVLTGLISGIVFILITHMMIEKFNRKGKYNSYKLLLVSALVFHNFPEGMGAGASLAGMHLSDAIPLQIAISIQNVAEGLLLTLLLQGLGFSLNLAVIGGILSGLVEMSGAVLAGFVLQQTQAFLPFFLSLAGGAMMMSVLMELYESRAHQRPVKLSQMGYGLLTIPLTNLLLGI